MQVRNNVIDFAAYRFTRDLRLQKCGMKEASEAEAWAEAFRQPRAPSLSDEAAAHRARMLAHLAEAASDRS